MSGGPFDAIRTWYAAEQGGDPAAALAASVDLEARDRAGRTVLMDAVAPYGGDPAFVAWLLDKGADPNVRDPDGFNTASWGYRGVTSNLERGQVAEIVDLLFAAGFEERPDDATEHSIDPSQLRRRLADLDDAGREGVAMRLCRDAVQAWRESAARGILPEQLADPRGGHPVDVGSTLAERAWAAIESGAMDDALTTQLGRVAHVVADRRVRAGVATRFTLLALWHLGRRRCHGVAVDPILIIHDALAARQREDRSRALRAAIDGPVAGAGG